MRKTRSNKIYQTSTERYRVLNIDQQVWIPTITTILIFIVGYFLSVANDWRRERNRKIKAIESMIGELEAFVTFMNNFHSGDTTPTVDGKTVFRGVRIQTASFDSMLYSNVFHDLDVKTQIKISDYYEAIKSSNQFNQSIIEFVLMRDMPSPLYDTNWRELATNFENRLMKNRDNALEIIERLKNVKPSAILCRYPSVD